MRKNTKQLLFFLSGKLSNLKLVQIYASCQKIISRLSFFRSEIALQFYFGINSFYQMKFLSIMSLVAICFTACLIVAMSYYNGWITPSTDFPRISDQTRNRVTREERERNNLIFPGKFVLRVLKEIILF